MNDQATATKVEKRSLGSTLFWSAFHAAVISIAAFAALPLLAELGVKHGVDRWITLVVGGVWLLFLAWMLVISPWVPRND